LADKGAFSSDGGGDGDGDTGSDRGGGGGGGEGEGGGEHRGGSSEAIEKREGEFTFTDENRMVGGRSVRMGGSPEIFSTSSRRQIP